MMTMNGSRAQIYFERLGDDMVTYSGVEATAKVPVKKKLPIWQQKQK